MSNQLSKENKLRLVQLVNENKALLFGKHGPNLTNNNKLAKWKSIYDELVSHGAVIKDVQYLRDTTWDNLKRSTVKKRNNYANTGAAGGKRYTEVENTILEILDLNSAYLSGLGQEDIAPTFVDATGHAPDASFLDITTQSNFNIGASFSAPSASFATPHPPLQRPERSSTPVESDLAGTQSTAIPKKRKRGPPTTLWADDTYKEFKMKKIEKDLEEQEIKIELMKIQIVEAHQKVEAEKQRCEAEKQRALYYAKARLESGSNPELQMRSQEQSDVSNYRL